MEMPLSVLFIFSFNPFNFPSGKVMSVFTRFSCSTIIIFFSFTNVNDEKRRSSAKNKLHRNLNAIAPDNHVNNCKFMNDFSRLKYYFSFFSRWEL